MKIKIKIIRHNKILVTSYNLYKISSKKHFDVVMPEYTTKKQGLFSVLMKTTLFKYKSQMAIFKAPF